MSKIVIMIDGWFMRKRVYQTKAFYYSGLSIRKYCMKYLGPTDTLYRIFYYDTEPLNEKGHNPITKKHIDFGKTSVALQQLRLLNSIRRTPNFALRLGKIVWRNNAWLLTPQKFKDLMNGKITVKDLTEYDVRPHLEQKAVDMKIGLDIALIATKRLADKLIIITGDADLVPALKFARREGMEVGIDPLHCPIQAELSEHVDFITSKLRMPSKAPASGTPSP